MMVNCRTNVCPAIVHPTKCCVKHHFINNIVPEIHPTHTTHVNHINYEHQHYFPHTESVVNQVTNTQSFGPGPGFGYPRPRPGFGPMGGPMPGPMGGPMFPY
ncbi:CotD family spore coat protein [Siminovitchia sediminis]|uniref:CotD family spore coat protein n=1 Tax=Siminovitchia sediminis TaxID=1274353 RepID=A0ABW4KGV8_9BACI